jgi:phenylalanyl-tRNA synthetase beta chain
MRVPLSWLRELTPVEASADELAERMPILGLQVEEVVRAGAELSGVVVARVLAVEELPGAERLSLARVDAGDGPREVLVGVRNMRPGDLVPYAPPGARLPGGVEIRRREMLGRVSDGMLCSPRELGISDDHAGIMILGDDLKPGEDLRDALGLDEEILEIDVTPNRPDCLSIVGVAREVAALYRLPLAVPEPTLREEGPPIEALASVAVHDRRGCPRYLARAIVGVRVGPSPWWMRRRLLACGLRPISGPVDVTNYVLLERGHPLHAFDLARLAGRRIVVRRPRRGERTITTLDGVERGLEPEDVLICDAERPVAVAGIMGGAETEVGEGTTEILLEAAHFDPTRILRTARRMGLRTEASVRFERGADPEAVPAAAARAAALIAEVAGGVVARGALDLRARTRAPRPIRLRPTRVRALLGAPIDAERMAEGLRALGCRVEERPGALRVTPPSFRPDLRIEEDLVEEVARLHGYDRIPLALPATGQVGGETREQALRRLVRRALLGAGLSEAQTLSLIPPGLPDRLGLGPDHPWRRTLRLANPLSEEESALRPSLLPGLLLAAARNVARRTTTVMLFEVGTVFEPSAGELPVETRRVAWVLTGPAPLSWHERRSLDVFDAKAVLERLAGALGVAGVSVRPEPLDGLHPGRAGRVLLDGRPVGILGELHPRAARALDLVDGVACGEVDLAPLLAAAREAAPGELPRFPAVVRDLALLVPTDTPAAEVERAIRRAAGPLLEGLAIFDVYPGDRIGRPGEVSLAYTLSFRHPARTLTDDEVSGVMASVEEACRAAGWTVR